MISEMPPPTSQNAREFSRLLDLYVERQPKKVLEIGTHEGGTLYWWLNKAQPGTLVGSIDVQRIQPENYEGWCAPDVKCIWNTARSNEASSIKFGYDYFSALDWLFIDGGHSYDEVSDDWFNYLPLMRKGGVVAFHDIMSYPPYASEVDLFWNKIKREHNALEIIEPNHYTPWGMGPGIGVIFV